MHTLTVPFLACNVNVRPSPHAAGLPSANAINGLAHAIVRLISQMMGVSVADHGAALALNTYTLLPGRQKHQLAMIGDDEAAKKGKGAPLLDDRVAMIEGWLVLRFEAGISDMSKIGLNLEDLAEQIQRLGFAGGTLEILENLRLIENDDLGNNALCKLPSYARLVVDQTDYLGAYAACYEIDHFEALLRLLVSSEQQMQNYNKPAAAKEIQEGEEGDKADQTTCSEEDQAINDELEADKADWETAYLGRLVPIDIGYRALEAPKPRNARGGYLHVYAEPVTGLARIQLVASYLRQKADNAFWKHHNKHPIYISTGVLTNV